MVVNIGKCPFGSYSFQHQIHGCAESYFSQATVDCPYFLYWYEFLRGHDDKDTGLKKNFLDYSRFSDNTARTGQIVFDTQGWTVMDIVHKQYLN